MLHLAVLVASLAWLSSCDGACDTQDKGVSKEDQDMIVKKHNDLRSMVATGMEGNLPKASNMLEMVWDDKVAEKAQEWANNCKYENDSPKDRSTGRGYTGQNIAYRSNQDKSADWKEVIEDFYSEVSDFNPKAIDKFFSQEKFGHFTQVIWANSTKIGCGYVMYPDGDNYYHLYGCNYLPGGNIVGEPIYLKGEPCSECGGCGSIDGLCESPSKITQVPMQ